ncbi:hypothetical protein H7F15_07205 [Pontibacter sp. Tf4]|uniref:hypothetical protein n=1 Tax=Pontibacter sp. Tf4 TaxID=2761620 RepID=UPI0016297618|nr:hypothetical protein [Pontibacter sp. Tf4]MBB6610819.1 hypothetical protein [Pontibacter sp. Tf4]
MDKQELKKFNGDIFFEAQRAADNSYIYANWIGVQSLESIVMGGNLLLAMLRKQHCPVIVNNTHEQVGPWEVGINFLVYKWAPEAKVLGVKYFAHILSYGIFGRTSFDTFAPLVSSFFEVAAFEDENTAKIWAKAKATSSKVTI